MHNYGDLSVNSRQLNGQLGIRLNNLRHDNTPLKLYREN